MEFTRNCNANGTCLQGYINVEYATLVDCFGAPDDNYDSYKSDANWDITFEDGTVACIYNWKNGRNYCGDEGEDLEYMTEWNVGGNSRAAVQRVNEALMKNRNKATAYYGA